MKVFVYFNLHKKCWSIKAQEGPYKNRVIAHRDSLTLTNVVFKVSEAGRQRVIKEQRKNVHAGAVGHWLQTEFQQRVFEHWEADARAITYNPYRCSSFVYSDSREPISTADRAVFLGKSVWVV